MPPKKWTQQRIIEALQQRHQAGLCMTHAACEPMSQAAARLFGGWYKALQAANVSPQPRGVWNRQRVIEEFQRRHRDGLPLTNLRKQDEALYNAAHTYFGSVTRACRAAGIPQPPRHRKWDRERVIAELQRLQREGLCLSSRSNTVLVGAAHRVFGSWREALRAADLPCPSAHQSWNRQAVLDEIRRRQREGLPLTRRANGALAYAATVYLGGWSKALEAVGIEPRRRNWSKEDVIQEIFRRHERGEILTLRTNIKLTHAAEKHFGNLNSAIRAAGLTPRWPSPTKPPIRWTKQRVLKGIQDYWRRNGTLKGIGAQCQPLYCAGQRFFGSWPLAVKAAGLKPTTRQRWTKQRVIDELRKCQGVVTKNISLQAAAIYRFGSMREARLAAGVPLPKRWTPKRVIEQLQDQYTKGRPMGTKQSDWTLVWAARKHFGTWAAALRAAGLGHVETRRARHGRNEDAA